MISLFHVVFIVIADKNRVKEVENKAVFTS